MARDSTARNLTLVHSLNALESGYAETQEETFHYESFRGSIDRRFDELLAQIPDLARRYAAGGPFPPVMIHMIASGEATGELPDMLERTAKTLSGEVERRTLALTSLLEPLLILVMGAIVLMIVLAVLLPIIEINQLVR
jgi:general secretion pathway protein F